MNGSRNWYPFRRWLREQMLSLIDRYLAVPVEPKKYRTIDKPAEHHKQARQIKRCLLGRIKGQSRTFIWDKP